MANGPMLIARPPTSFFFWGEGAGTRNNFDFRACCIFVARAAPCHLQIWSAHHHFKSLSPLCYTLPPAQSCFEAEKTWERERGSGRAWFKTNSKYTVKRSIHLHHLWKKSELFQHVVRNTVGFFHGIPPHTVPTQSITRRKFPSNLFPRNFGIFLKTLRRNCVVDIDNRTSDIRNMNTETKKSTGRKSKLEHGQFQTQNAK